LKSSPSFFCEGTGDAFAYVILGICAIGKCSSW
jgi:hypothetical protein